MDTYFSAAARAMRQSAIRKAGDLESVAADLISRRVVNLAPMISATYPMDEAAEAFAHASDRKRATKVQLDLAGQHRNREAS